MPMASSSIFEPMDFFDSAPINPANATTSATQELLRYLERKDDIPGVKADDPLAWWRVHKIVYPRMARLAREYLSITGSSSSPERIFSCSGEVCTQDRQALAPKTIERLTRSVFHLRRGIQPEDKSWDLPFSVIQSAAALNDVRVQKNKDKQAKVARMLQESSQAGPSSSSTIVEVD
jgi:hypothetical protein